MVTAETAATIPVVMLVLALVLTSVRVGVDQMRCIDAARAGARAAARGDDDSRVHELVRRSAPSGATVSVTRGPRDAVVTVIAPPVLDVPLLTSLPTPNARAVGALEGGGTGGVSGS